MAQYVKNSPEATVFTSEDGTHLWISNFRKNVWWRALDAAGIPRVVTIQGPAAYVRL